MNDERFSEKEVALVIRRAADIDARGASASTGMTVEDIESIATEAGIGVESVRQALAEIGGQGDRPKSLLHAPLSQRASGQIPRALSREQLQALVQAIEDETGRPGTVSEALGTVRWTAADGRGRVTTQVSLSAGRAETRIAVHERIGDAVARVARFLPTAWGGILGMGLTANFSASPLTTVLGVAATAAVGNFLGRGALAVASRKSRARVDRLTARLTETARGMGSASENAGGVTTDMASPI